MEEAVDLDALVAHARLCLKENLGRADKLENVLCILQGKQDGAKRALEEAVTRHVESVLAWKTAFRQVVDSEFVHKVNLLRGHLAAVRRATVGLHAGLDRLEALRFSPAAAAAAPAVADLVARYIAESREVCPDLLLDFAFREVPPDRWARSRPAVGYLQTSSLAPTDLTLEELAVDGLTAKLRAASDRPRDPATVTHLSYSVIDADGAEVTDVVWEDGRDGTFTVTFKAARPGAHVVSVYLYNVHVNASPCRVHVGDGVSRLGKREASAQTDSSPGEAPEEDFVSWMRARLERELSKPSPQAAQADAASLRRPVVGSGRLRLPTKLDANDNVVEDWNAHLFDESTTRSALSAGEEVETAAERLRQILAEVRVDGAGDAPARPAAGPTVVPGVPKDLAGPLAPIPECVPELDGETEGELELEESEACWPAAVPEKTPERPAPPEPPVIKVTTREEAPGGKMARVVTVEEGSGDWWDGAGKRRKEKPELPRALKTVDTDAKPRQNEMKKKHGEDSKQGSGAQENSQPRSSRSTPQRAVRTVHVTSDDLSAGTPDLSRGPVTATLDLLLRPNPLFKRPIGVAFGASAAGETVFVADTGNDVVRAFGVDGEERELVAELRRPSALAALSGKRLAVRYDGGVRIYNTAASPAAQLLQLGSGQLRRPFGLAVTPSERLVTIDTAGRRFVAHVFDASEAGGGQPVHSVDLAPVVRDPETAKLYFVAASETRLAVTDLGNNVVYLLNWEGRLVTIVGVNVRPEARLSDPAGLALDGAGNLLVADSKHHRIMVYGADGDPRGKVATSHKLNRPSGICVSGGRLLVLNYWENTAHRYTLACGKE